MSKILLWQETKSARSILYCVTWSSIAAYKSLLLLPRRHRDIPWTPRYLGAHGYTRDIIQARHHKYKKNIKARLKIRLIYGILIKKVCIRFY